MKFGLSATTRRPGECFLVKPDGRIAIFVSQHHADDVESASSGFIATQPLHIASCDRNDVQLLGCIDGHLRRHEAWVRMCLHFYEAKYASVPSDQVDLTSTMGRTEVLRDDTIALVSEVEVRFHLAATGRDKVLRIFSAKTPGRNVQEPRDESSEVEHIRLGNC